jgi:hypothetical protein
MKNVGKIDQIVRLLIGLTLVFIGLFVLGGNRGNFLGIGVTLCSALPFYVFATRSCPVFLWLKINSLSKKEKESIKQSKPK